MAIQPPQQTRSAEQIFFEYPVPEHLRLTPEKWERARTVPILSIDYESSNVRTSAAAIKKWGLSILAELTAVGISFSSEHGDGVVLLAPFDEEALAFLQMIYTRPDLLILVHNGLFDFRGSCVRLGLPIPQLTFDTFVNAVTMGVTALDKAGLDDQCASYEEVHAGDVDYTVINPDDDDYGKSYTGCWTNWHKYLAIKKQRDNLHNVPPQDLAWYVLEDARLTYKLYEAQMDWVEILEADYGYEELSNLIEIDQRYTWVAYHWAVEGFAIDAAYIRRQLDWIEEKLFDLDVEFVSLGNGPLDSYEAKVRYLFDVAGIPRPDKNDPEQAILFTSTGLYSFGKVATAYYAETFPAETAKLVYYEHLRKTSSTLAGYLAHATYDGRIHPMVGIGTITGRSSSTNPNTLNVSVKLPEEIEALDDAMTLSARGCIIADDGEVLVEYDFQAAEKRAQAIESGEVKLAEIFRDGLDMHNVNGAIFFPAEWARLTAIMQDETLSDAERAHAKDLRKTKRSHGKTTTFGMDYGMGPAKTARRLKITIDEAKEMFSNFNAEYAILTQWKRSLQDTAAKRYEEMRLCPNKLFAHGYVENAFGRRILIDDPSFDRTTEKLREYWYKGTNYVPQSLVADVVKIATWKAYWDLKQAGCRSRIQQQVHDAVIVRVVPEEIEQVSEIITWAMSTSIRLEQTTVRDIYVEWPAEVDHAENAKKWGYRDSQPYPFPTKDEDGNPIRLGCDQRGVYDYLLADYKRRMTGKTEEQWQLLSQLLVSGPLSGPDAFVLWINDSNQFEWRRWNEITPSLAALTDMANRMNTALAYKQIPAEYIADVIKFVEFVHHVLTTRQRILANERTFARLVGEDTSRVAVGGGVSETLDGAPSRISYPQPGAPIRSREDRRLR